MKCTRIVCSQPRLGWSYAEQHRQALPKTPWTQTTFVYELSFMLLLCVQKSFPNVLSLPYSVRFRMLRSINRPQTTWPRSYEVPRVIKCEDRGRWVVSEGGREKGESVSGIRWRVLCCVHATTEWFAGDFVWDCTDPPTWQSAFPCSWCLCWLSSWLFFFNKVSKLSYRSYTLL